MIFYEAPHKLTDTLKHLSETFGSERRISLCRELTKLHEEVLRMSLGEAMSYYGENAPRGEYVLIVEGASVAEEEPVSVDDALSAVQELMDTGLSKKDAVKQVALQLGLPKNELYQAALQI